jgi:hypothetical protein
MLSALNSHTLRKTVVVMINNFVKGKGKTVPLQVWSGPESFTKLRFPDFVTTTQDGGKVVSLLYP